MNNLEIGVNEFNLGFLREPTAKLNEVLQVMTHPLHGDYFDPEQVRGLGEKLSLLLTVGHYKRGVNQLEQKKTFLELLQGVRALPTLMEAKYRALVDSWKDLAKRIPAIYEEIQGAPLET